MINSYFRQGVPGGPGGLDHIRSSANSQSVGAGSNRVGLSGGATAPLESTSSSASNGKMGLPLDVLCKNCRKEANFMCSACKSVHYCSIDCQVNIQKDHFKFGAQKQLSYISKRR